MRVLIADHQPLFIDLISNQLRGCARVVVAPQEVSLRRSFLPHVIVGSHARVVANDAVLLQAATVATGELPAHLDAWPRGWLEHVAEMVRSEAALRMAHECIPESGQQASWYALRALAFARDAHRVLLVGPTRMVLQTAAGQLYGDEYAYGLSELSEYEVRSVLPISRPSMHHLGSFRQVLSALPSAIPLVSSRDSFTTQEGRPHAF